MKMWVTKYALTDGIRERSGEVSHEYFCYYTVPPMSGLVMMKIGRDAHPTKEAAVEAAEAMRVKKLRSLEKQMKKLRDLRF